jgi:glutamate formiminotransferase/formiminotetrahydrofolate cyclodeaminase
LKLPFSHQEERRIDRSDQHTVNIRASAPPMLSLLYLFRVSRWMSVGCAAVWSRVGEELGIPVYLYEFAATRPERANLENLRRGQFEGLRDEIAHQSGAKAGLWSSATGKRWGNAIGARNALIAFNVYLTTADVDIAKRIARAIRQSTGGLRYVKALGLLVDGMAQVSINLTNFRNSPVARVVELIRREAGRYGASIHHSELIGLIPQEALVDAAVWYTQLDGFSPDQILESRVHGSWQAALVSAGPSRRLWKVAAAKAAPGGGWSPRTQAPRAPPWSKWWRA